MLFPRVPGWYAQPKYGGGAGASSSSSTPVWGQSASYRPTGTPAASNPWNSAQSPQATGGWASPTQSTGWSSETSQYGSYPATSTATATFSQAPAASPTTVPSPTTDLPASSAPTSVPDQTITTNTEGENFPLPISSITESGQPISSAPSSSASAAQEFPEEKSGNTGAILCGVFFVVFLILSSALIALCILRKRRSQGVNYRKSKKLSKVRSEGNRVFAYEASDCSLPTRNIMITAPFIGGEYPGSAKEFIIAGSGFNERSITAQTSSAGITHNKSVGKSSARSGASTTNSILDPFMRYKYPRQQSPVPDLPRCPPAAYSRSSEKEENNFNSLNSTTSLLCKISPVSDEAPCWSSEDARLREKLEPRTSGVTGPSGYYSPPKRSFDMMVPEMPSYSRTSTFRSEKKSGSFGGTEGRNSGLTSFLDNYSYDRSELPHYPSGGLPQRIQNSPLESSGSSSGTGMTVVVSDHDGTSQMLNSSSPGNDLCVLGLDFPGGIPDQQPLLGPNRASSTKLGYLQ
ncbi:hypothetical protein PtA15_7A50 [Puccinia triticina]|uniref:REJ domain-containing protein n=1 Tax=Puccinia triticina TaxID=208348 RepID=A0ABY7CM71_9BASI|nr:uncharacterized protein PtA15_7A50 [Puccinia triticina]WAQ86324.1 hypothetical protein PtA15_7A50 [Puccinia triticina]WAR56200.1 hypothetical protein PtB15_7B45 [Puccinia triticina]